MFEAMTCRFPPALIAERKPVRKGIDVEINLLRQYPKAKRNIAGRKSAKTPENVALAKQYGEAYFDGSRDTGYGGYRYDGRWVPIARDMVEHWGLKPGMRVLDVGCAKGFLVQDLMTVCPGLEVFGLDISEYAVQRCDPSLIGRLHVGDARHLPFPDDSFDAVICINVVHNFNREECIGAIREISRVARGKSYIQVDAYRDEAERQLTVDWILTAETYLDPASWRKLFNEAGYTGDFYWTITE